MDRSTTSRLTQFVLICALGFFALQPAPAQESAAESSLAQARESAAGQAPAQPDMGLRLRQFVTNQSDQQGNAAVRTSGPLPPVGEVAADETVRSAYRQAWLGYYAHEIWAYKHQREGFEWQLQSSRIIFYVVVLLVLVGIVFSGIQFYRALRGKGELDTTELEVGAKGFKVKSTVLGVIILLISFLFYYLYLVHVYPITITGG